MPWPELTMNQIDWTKVRQEIAIVCYTTSLDSGSCIGMTLRDQADWPRTEKCCKRLI